MNDVKQREGKGVIRLQLQRDDTSDGDGTVVAEVSAVSGSRKGKFQPLQHLIRPRQNSLDIPVPAGLYYLRLTTPNGDVFAESVAVSAEEATTVTFELRDSQLRVLAEARSLPQAKDASSWLGNDLYARFLLDRATTLNLDHLRLERSPRIGRANAGRFGMGLIVAQPPTSELLADWSTSLNRTLDPRVWVMGPSDHTLPQAGEELADGLKWWFDGISRQELEIPLRPAEHGLRLQVGTSELPQVIGNRKGEKRAFVSTKDPVGGTHFSVLPYPWRRPFPEGHGREAFPVVNLVSADDRTSWRLVTRVDDAPAMSYLGYLHSGAQKATQALLEDATTMLFEKTVNPIAAAGGAYGLLAYGQTWPDRHWRQWVKNLYAWFPDIPDGAIAMAILHLRFGEESLQDEVMVERVRGYALEAVRRGVPYFTRGVSLLTETLLLLVRDDELHDRTGDASKDTRTAFNLAKMLGQAAVPGEYFTTLRFEES